MKITVSQLATELGLSPAGLTQYAPLHSIHPDAYIPGWIATGIRRQHAEETGDAPRPLTAWEPSECMKAAVSGAAARVIHDGGIDQAVVHVVMAVAMADLGAQRIAGYEGALDGDVDTEHMDALFDTIMESISTIATAYAANRFLRQAFDEAFGRRMS